MRVVIPRHGAVTQYVERIHNARERGLSRLVLRKLLRASFQRHGHVLAVSLDGDGGPLVACVAFTLGGDRAVDLDALHVDVRARRQSHGRVLLRALRGYAPELIVSTRSGPGMALLRAEGARVWERLDSGEYLVGGWGAEPPGAVLRLLGAGPVREILPEEWTVCEKCSVARLRRWNCLCDTLRGGTS